MFDSISFIGSGRVAQMNPNSPSIIGQGYNPIVFADDLPATAREQLPATARESATVVNRNLRQTDELIPTAIRSGREMVMKNIKVLGTGCANCRTTLRLIEEAARAMGVAVQLDKVEDIKDIMGFGVMSTPGVVIDGKVVHAGGVPGRDKIEQWLAGP